MPDDSTLRCAQDEGGLSHCQLEHTNGFVSSTNGGGAAPLLMLIAAIVEHRAHKAEKHLLDAIDMEIKTFYLVSDWNALAFDVFPAHLTALPPQWQEWQQTAYEFRKEMAETLSEEKDLMMGPVYPAQYKGIHQLHDLAILEDCSLRDNLVHNLDPLRKQVLPNDILRGIAAVDADVISLKNACSSTYAVKLLAKNRKTASPRAANP